MEPCLSSRVVLTANENLKIIEATESSCIGPSRSVQTTSLDHLLGAPLPDSIPGMDPAEALDACRTILSGESFPGGFTAYRNGIIVFDPGPERRVFFLAPRLDDGNIVGVNCTIARTFLQYPQADAMTAEAYQSMVENCMEFMFVIDQLGFHTYVSPMIKGTMGEEPDRVYGMHMSDVVHPDDVERCQSILNEVIEKDLPATDIQYRIILPDGSMRHIAVSGHRFANGDHVRIMGIAKDVTETMELRRKLHARQEALTALSNIVLTLSGKGGLEDALRSALGEILAFLRLPMGGIYVLNSDGTEFIAGVTIGGEQPPLTPPIFFDQLSRLCPEPGQVQVIRDLATDGRMTDTIRDLLLSVGVQSFVMARLQAMQGQQHAYMSMPIATDHELSVEQIEFLNLATGILGPAVENAVLQGELADRANRLAMLERMALSINSGLDVPSVFTACQSALRELIACDETCLVVFGTNGISDVYAFLGSDELVHNRKKLTKHQVQMFSAMTKARSMHGMGSLSEYRVQHKEHNIDSGSIAAAPLVYKGTVTGLLKIRALRDNAFGRRETSILQTVAEHLAIAVTNARLYEAEHARSLELEALGREMQHRVKNNLQAIAGLLSISSQGGEQSERALERCLGQVRAISTVHSLLTPKHAVTGMRLRKLLMEVAQAAVTAAGRSEEIRVTVEGGSCKLSPDTAVALGVIVNELVSNSIEHGLCGRDAGEISIAAGVEPTRTVVEISDDGAGLPKGFRAPRRANSGLGLVRSLVESGLHGKFTIRRSRSGTTARIEF